MKKKTALQCCSRQSDTAERCHGVTARLHNSSVSWSATLTYDTEALCKSEEQPSGWKPVRAGDTTRHQRCVHNILRFHRSCGEQTRGRGRVLVHPARAGTAPRQVRRDLRHPSRGCKTSRLTCANGLVCWLAGGVPLVFRCHSHITRADPLLHTFLLLLLYPRLIGLNRAALT